MDEAIALKADKADTYTKTEVDAKDNLKADKADTYTKADVDGKDALKADLSEIEAARGTEATLGARLDSTDAQLNEKANIQQEEWITPTLLNGWYAIRQHEPPQYMKDSLGFVHFRGAIGKSTESTSNIAFTLPVGYRPEVITSFSGVEIAPTGFRSLAVSVNHLYGSVDFAGAKTSGISWYILSHTFKAV